MPRTTRLLLAASLLACDSKPPTQPPAPVAATPAPPPAEPEPVCNYLALIDAGSTGSRAYVYTYTSQGAQAAGLPTLQLLASAQAEPGLSSFKAEPTKAGDSITALLAAGGSVLASVPEKCRASTPTAVMATAGMRLLAAEDGGEAITRAIYDSVQKALVGAGLDARFTGTISGQQEALYGWISVNYALGTLLGDQPTVGSLDLGGDSTEIAFVAECPADVTTIAAKFGPKSHHVYAHSYLGLGQDFAHAHVSAPACEARGRDQGTGKYAQCVARLDAVVKPKSCPGAVCGLAQPGDRARVGVVQPAIPAGMKFYATSGYHYTRKFLGLPEQTTPAALREAAGGPKGSTGYCGRKWQDITAQYTSESPQRLAHYCFSAAWIDVLLRNFGFAAVSDAITFTDKIGELDTGWTLGAALCSATGCLQAPAPAAAP